MIAIVAVYSDWGIGRDGRQPIVIPEDRRYFKEMTDGGVVIVGRKTFEEFPGPLSNRKTIVLSQDIGFKTGGVILARSVDEVLAELSGDDSDRVFVAGGGDIYQLLLPLCVYTYVTKIGASPLSDSFFPDLDALSGWSLESESGIMNSVTGFNYSFCKYRRAYV